MNSEAVILVVGDQSSSKAPVANALAERRGASHVEITKAGARIFRRDSSSEATIVDTTPLMTYGHNTDRYIGYDATVWITLNSLRRFFGKLIYVVCTVTSSGPGDSIHQECNLLKDQYGWLDLLAFIFKGHTSALMMLVEYKMSGMSKTDIKDALQGHGFARDNIKFSWTREVLGSMIELILLRSVYRSESTPWAGEDTLAPFFLEEVTSNSPRLDTHGPWGPTRVILFGRTGSGKSTLAQMLTLGRVDPESTDFASSSSIRGETKELKHGEGRGWYVVDTPGFGEPTDGTVCSVDAEKRIKKYVQLFHGVYSHYIYVTMKDRIDKLEERLWEFFVLLFAKDDTQVDNRVDIKRNFTVVVSNANPHWVEQNKDHLRANFKGCESFLSGEFPPPHPEDDEWEEELEEVRGVSLKQLEDELHLLLRYPIPCDFGLFSKTNIHHVRAGMTLERNHMKTVKQKAIGFSISRWEMEFGRLRTMLTQDDKIVLLPLC